MPLPMTIPLEQYTDAQRAQWWSPADLEHARQGQAAHQAERVARRDARRALHNGQGNVPGVPTGVLPPVVAPPATREGFLQQVNQQFNPGFEVGAVPSSLLDDAINSILTEQQTAAQQYLDRGKARGIYNDVGYQAGQSQIGNQASIGRSDLSSLGSTVVDKYRGMADAIGDEAYTAARGFEPGGSFSLDPYISQFNDVKSRALANSAGDLRGLMGGRNYFDFSSLANRAGQAQGAQNLRDTDVATALAERRRKNSISRGLGSTGAF